MKHTCTLLCCCLAFALHAQQSTPLSVEYIMRDPKWIGSSPSNPFWSADGKLYFSWNPEKALSDSLYNWQQGGARKISLQQGREIVAADELVHNQSRTAYVYAKEGDIWYRDKNLAAAKRITQTTDTESDPVFSFGDSKVVFRRAFNLYAWDIRSGATEQLTNFQKGAAPSPAKSNAGEQEKWLKEDQLALFDVLRSRKEKKEKGDSLREAASPKTLRALYTDDRFVGGTGISSSGRFIHYRLYKAASGARSTIVPSYVTQSGFTEEIPARTKVGAPQGSQELYLYDRQQDTVYFIKADSTIPGMLDIPEYVQDYPTRYAAQKQKPALRSVNFSAVTWAPGKDYAVVDLRATDNKDRWLLRLNENGSLHLLDRQHDSAWIGGPGIGGSYGGGNYGWINETDFWFQSEKTGYSHLYRINVVNRQVQALTAGNFEILSARLSADKKKFYLTSNYGDAAQQHFFHLPANGGNMVQLTRLTGAHQVEMSPDEKQLAILYSSSNRPWELYLQENKTGSQAMQLTNAAMSPEFKAYRWREPQIVQVPARDGALVPARLYVPEHPHPGHPAVVFVHGAGYLQNAHKWWSSYFREYMFHNLLADQGYTVLDMDYRASAGYGRQWRTDIYRFMGGRDLTDNIDGAKFLVDKYGVDPKRIGIYGGSYGGFITLMALFTSPGVFAAGAALRPVTDWAHYNQGYTANILNEPAKDSLAYRRSSPIYHAAGLQDHLLICHGMVDVNVHFEDVVRLQQRLIELGKNNWELAAYPMEDHGFVEPSSWTDEYKRIFRLFEKVLKQP